MRAFFFFGEFRGNQKTPLEINRIQGKGIFYFYQLYSSSMKRLAKIPSSGTYPLGFRIGAAHCGIKKNGVTDLAALVSDKPASAAGVFTSNVFKAAPVVVDQEVLRTTKGEGIRSIVVNSGCANAVTGTKGVEDAKTIIATADKVLGQAKSSTPSSLSMSTGVIGQLLPLSKITDGIPKLYNQLGSSHESWLACARGIMTTDTFPKLVSREFHLDGNTYRLAGMAKGAGMIHPNMATLLGFLATDAPVGPQTLSVALKEAVNKSFNSISVDGDMSTNDTIVALANGAAGGTEIEEGSPQFKVLVSEFTEAAVDLAKLVVRDGEGATKFITIRVEQAETPEDAKRACASIATSMLVKTAMYGKDANWGRILCAIGYSGSKVNPTQTSVAFVPTDGSPELPLLVNGEPEQVDEARASEILALPDLEIRVQLGVGSSSANFWTCDLSHEYVTINGDYRS